MVLLNQPLLLLLLQDLLPHATVFAVSYLARCVCMCACIQPLFNSENTRLITTEELILSEPLAWIMLFGGAAAFPKYPNAASQPHSG